MQKIKIFILLALCTILFLTACSAGGAQQSKQSNGKNTKASSTPVSDKTTDTTSTDAVYKDVMNTIKSSKSITDPVFHDFSKLGGMRLGAYFWYGFSYMGDHYTQRLLEEFADREPVWGWTNDTEENMEQQIDYASASGLSYFAFDWYYNGTMQKMNRDVDTFLSAKNSKKMDFCLNVCNEEDARITKDNWQAAVDAWLPYLENPQNIKVDGKPVIMFFSSYWLQYCLGGTENTNACFKYLNDKLVAAGLPGVCIIASECPYGTPDTREIDFNVNNFSDAAWKQVVSDRKVQGFSGLTGYNYRQYSPVTLSDGTQSYCIPYEKMTAEHEQCWKAFSDYNMPYVPCILGGWDCRPWETDWAGNSNGSRSCYAADRTPTALYKHIIDAAEWLKSNPKCSVGNLAILYAWNEYCEGGYIAPTKGDDGRLLSGVRQAMKKINEGTELWKQNE